MITQDNIYQHEFTGLDTQIVESKNPQLIGLNGRVTHETKSMFELQTSKGVKLIAKSSNTWNFKVEGQEIPVSGNKILKRPFDRIGGKA